MEKIMAVALAVLAAASAVQAGAAYGQYGQGDLEAVLQAMEHPDMPPTPEQMAEQRVIEMVGEAGLAESGAFNASVVTLEAGAAKAGEVPAAAPQQQQQPVVNNIYITMPAQGTAMEEQLSQYWPLLLAVLIPIAALGIYFLFPMAKAKSDQMSINSAITAAKIADVGKSERVQGLDSQYFNALSSRMATNSANSAEALKEVAMQDVVRAQEEAATKKKDA